MNAWFERWHAMTSRERQMVSAAMVVVLVALVWLVAIDPALEGRKRLERELPQLRAQAAEVAGLAQIAKQRPARPSSAARGDLRQQIEGALASLPDKPTISSTGSAVTLKFERASYPGIAQWAGRTVRDTGTRIDSATVVPASESGRANIELTFAR